MPICDSERHRVRRNLRQCPTRVEHFRELIESVNALVLRKNLNAWLLFALKGLTGDEGDETILAFNIRNNFRRAEGLNILFEVKVNRTVLFNHCSTPLTASRTKEGILSKRRSVLLPDTNLSMTSSS